MFGLLNLNHQKCLFSFEVLQRARLQNKEKEQRQKFALQLRVQQAGVSIILVLVLALPKIKPTIKHATHYYSKVTWKGSFGFARAPANNNFGFILSLLMFHFCKGAAQAVTWQIRWQILYTIHPESSVLLNGSLSLSAMVSQEAVGGAHHIGCELKLSFRKQLTIDKEHHRT